MHVCNVVLNLRLLVKGKNNKQCYNMCSTRNANIKEYHFIIIGILSCAEKTPRITVGILYSINCRDRLHKVLKQAMHM